MRADAVAVTRVRCEFVGPEAARTRVILALWQNNSVNCT